MTRGGYQKITITDQTEKVSFISLLFFRWMNVFFKIGSQRTLEESDFLPLSRENSTEFLTEHLQTSWNKEKAECKGSGKTPKLWRSLLKMISFTEAKIILLAYALYTLRRFLQPLFLGYLIYSLMEAEPLKNILLYCCVVAMGITDLIGLVMRNQFAYSCDVIGFRMSSALKSLLYHKVSN